MSMPDLPLTEGASESRVGDDAEIARVVAHFYSEARLDPVLGPIFERHVDDWEGHLRTMTDFWTSAVHRTGRYSGRPIEVHRRLPEIRGEHFRRWLRLWESSVDEVVHSEARVPLKHLAARMATTMSSRLGLEEEHGA